MLIGIDLLEIKRLERVVKRTPRFLQRVFTSGEINYCLGKKNPYPSLAVRFAAKEAVRKLHPELSRGRFHDIEVLNDESGRPNILLHGQVLEKSRQEQILDIKVSLSHSEHHAIASVIATKG